MLQDDEEWLHHLEEVKRDRDPDYIPRDEEREGEVEEEDAVGVDEEEEDEIV
jgi:hypothetical protein